VRVKVPLCVDLTASMVLVTWLPDDVHSDGLMATALDAVGMKSTTSPTPASVRKRVMRMAVSGKYSCLVVTESAAGRTRKWPPLRWSKSAPNMLGESKRGAQNQSIDPSVLTRALVWRSPIKPWSAIDG